MALYVWNFAYFWPIFGQIKQKTIILAFRSSTPLISSQICIECRRYLKYFDICLRQWTVVHKNNEILCQGT